MSSSHITPLFCAFPFLLARQNFLKKFRALSCKFRLSVVLCCKQTVQKRLKRVFWKGRNSMETPNRYYTPYTYRQAGESYFPSTEPDYKQVQNLIAGKGQAIIAYGSMKDVDMTPQFNTPDTENRLTDGVLAQQATTPIRHGSASRAAWLAQHSFRYRRHCVAAGGPHPPAEREGNGRPACRTTSRFPRRSTAWTLKTWPSSTASAPRRTPTSSPPPPKSSRPSRPLPARDLLLPGAYLYRPDRSHRHQGRLERPRHRARPLRRGHLSRPLLLRRPARRRPRTSRSPISVTRIRRRSRSSTCCPTSAI